MYEFFKLSLNKDCHGTSLSVGSFASFPSKNTAGSPLDILSNIFLRTAFAALFFPAKTKANFETMEEFLEKLKLNVEVKVSRLEH